VPEKWTHWLENPREEPPENLNISYIESTEGEG